MQSRELGSSENVFRYLRRTESEVATIPETLRQKFQPYLRIIQSSRKFMDERERQILIEGVMHDVRKYKSGDKVKVDVDGAKLKLS